MKASFYTSGIAISRRKDGCSEHKKRLLIAAHLLSVECVTR